jgi:hypothetical protein
MIARPEVIHFDGMCQVAGSGLCLVLRASESPSAFIGTIRAEPHIFAD